MTTIVKHRRTGNEYVLLGINGEANKANPSRLISELFNQEKSNVSCLVTICDVQGSIFLADIDDLRVVEIDGVQLADILPEDNNQASPKDLNYSERSPGTEFEEEDFETEDEDEDETELEQANQENAVPIRPVVVDVVDSLDAPNQDLEDEDEDWI